MTVILVSFAYGYRSSRSSFNVRIYLHRQECAFLFPLVNCFSFPRCARSDHQGVIMEEEEEEGKTIEMRRRRRRRRRENNKIEEEEIKTLRRENNKIMEEGIKNCGGK